MNVRYGTCDDELDDDMISTKLMRVDNGGHGLQGWENTYDTKLAKSLAHRQSDRIVIIIHFVVIVDILSHTHTEIQNNPLINCHRTIPHAFIHNQL